MRFQLSLKSRKAEFCIADRTYNLRVVFEALVNVGLQQLFFIRVPSWEVASSGQMKLFVK